MIISKIRSKSSGIFLLCMADTSIYCKLLSLLNFYPWSLSIFLHFNFYVPGCRQVYFIADDHPRSFLVLFEYLEPIWQTAQGLGIGDIEYKDHAMCIFQISWDQASISLLASCVPHLQPIQVSILDYIFNIKVYPNRWLSYLLSIHCNFDRIGLRSNARWSKSSRRSDPPGKRLWTFLHYDSILKTNSF